MITVKNYLEETHGIDFSKSESRIQKGHEFAKENIDLYGEDTDIDKAIDLHIEGLNKYLKTDSEKPKKKKIERPDKVSDKTKKLKTPITCPPVDEKGKNRIDAEGLALLQKCIDNEKTTAELTTENGKFTANREKLHDKIIAEFLEQKPCVSHQKPIAILTGGPPGSGKSHFLKTFAPWITSGKLYHIDADAVRAKLPEYKGWNADNTHEETSHIVKEMLAAIGKPCEHDLIYDGTMNKAKNYLPLIDRLKKLGYEVFVIYLQVPKELSISRAMERYQRTGRYVPISVINEVYDNGLQAFETVIKEADGYIRVNGETGKIVEKGGKEIPTDRDYSMEDCPTCEVKKEPRPKKQAETVKKAVAEKKQADHHSEMQALISNATSNSDHWSHEKVLHEAQKFEKLRKASSQTRDEKGDSKKRLSPTRENLIRWMKNPGNFDLIGVDTFKAGDATADLKIKKEVFWNRFNIHYKH